MKIIDADAHVIENESAWDYMLESERQFRPSIVGATSGDPGDRLLAHRRQIDAAQQCRKKPSGSGPGHERSEYSFKAHGRAGHRCPGDLSDDFYFPDGAPRRRSILRFAAATTAGWPISSAKRRTVFAGWWCRRCLTWITSPMSSSSAKSTAPAACTCAGLEADRRLAIPIFIRCMTPASEARFARFACTRRTAASRRMIFFSMSRDFANSSSPWWARFIRSSTTAFPERFPKLRIGIIEVSAQWIPYAIHDLARRHRAARQAVER